jgi:tRNA pseudouridine32 synthase/23S rRNA pseudouridine746 synthase
VLAFLCARFPHVPTAQWAARFVRGEIVDEPSGGALPLDAPYVAGQRIRYARDVPDEPTLPFAHRVLYQDAHLVVADKPHFLPTVPSGRYVRETLLSRLQRELQLPDLAPIHRIDQDTAGVVLFCVRPNERAAYQRVFAQRAVDKHYEAVAPTIALPSMPVRLRLVDAQHFMQMRVVDGEPNAQTHICAVGTSADGRLSRYTLRPKTGLRHQLRITMSHLGAPIANDRIYPALQPQLPISELAHTPPLQLLARAIAFDDPVTNEKRQFSSTFSLAPLNG